MINNKNSLTNYNFKITKVREWFVRFSVDNKKNYLLYDHPDGNGLMLYKVHYDKDTNRHKLELLYRDLPLNIRLIIRWKNKYGNWCYGKLNVNYNLVDIDYFIWQLIKVTDLVELSDENKKIYELWVDDMHKLKEKIEQTQYQLKKLNNQYEQLKNKYPFDNKKE